MTISKSDILKLLTQKVSIRLAELHNSLESLKNDRDNESKSSMGDKYETGRAMVQIEIDQIETQINQQKSYLSTIDTIRHDGKNEIVRQGALVETDKAIYYISVPMGLIDVDGVKVYCVSPVSPIGKALLEHSAEDQIEFNGTRISIMNIV